MSIPMPRLDDNKLFVRGFYCGSMMLKLDSDQPAEQLLWKEKGKNEQPQSTKALHAVMSTPYLKDGYIYGVCSYGQLPCLETETGERLWETPKTPGAKHKPGDR